MTGSNDKTPGGPGRRLPRARAMEEFRAAPTFVLVEPQMGENIGATARAMLNFGVKSLRLVNPRDGWPNEKAGAMAAGASAVLDDVQVFDSLDAALHDSRYVIATTARRRELMLPVLELREAAATAQARIAAGDPCAVVFGGERNGLSSDDVARADAILSVPVNPAFASLNLAQAACLVAYEWSAAARAGAETEEVDEEALDRRPAERAHVASLVDHLIDALDRANYFRPPEKRPLMTRNLRVALSRAGFTSPEVQSLHGALKALERSGNAS